MNRQFLAGKRFFLLLGFSLSFLMMAQAASAQESSAYIYDVKGRRDPFVPLVREGRIVGALKTRNVQPLRPVLYGILWDPEGNSIALINDLEVNQGDRVGMYTVEEIRADGVVLAREGGASVVLELVFEPTDPPKVSKP